MFDYMQYNGTAECQSLSSQYGRSRETHTTGLPSNKLQGQSQISQPNSQAQAVSIAFATI